MRKEPEHKISIVEEQQQGFVHLSEDEKLLLEIRKPAIEKLQSFTKMIRCNAAINKSRSK
jgi:hypothetical protein